MSYSRNAIHKSNKALGLTAPTHGLFIFIQMLNQENNLASENNKIANSSYCFDADAVNEFLTLGFSLDEFTKILRAFSMEVSLQYLKSPFVPDVIYNGIDTLNAFLGQIDPITKK